VTGTPATTPESPSSHLYDLIDLRVGVSAFRECDVHFPWLAIWGEYLALTSTWLMALTEVALTLVAGEPGRTDHLRWYLGLRHYSPHAPCDEDS
jgi:hypothetical protein